MSETPTKRGTLRTCKYYDPKSRLLNNGCVGDFFSILPADDVRGQECPNCRHTNDSWGKRLKKDPNAARLYASRLKLRSARMRDVITHVHHTAKVIPITRGKNRAA